MQPREAGSASLAEKNEWAGGVRLESLANLAHELRSPVQVLLGYLDILRDADEDHDAGSPRKSAEREQLERHVIERMNSNVHELALTVENLMEFALADAEAETVSEETIDLRGVFAELEPLLEAANHDKNLEIRVDLSAAPRFIKSRRRPLRSILANLAMNAVKFTAAGGVTITARKVGASGVDAIEFEVADTGPGFSAKSFGTAFEPMVQLSAASTRHHRGLGLGLTIVRRHLLALGGTVRVESEPSGSTFRATIPCSLPGGQELTAPSHSAGSHS